MHETTQSPAKQRTPAEINHRRAKAITEVDDILRAELTGPEILPVAHRRELRRCRALLAEWRLETD